MSGPNQHYIPQMLQRGFLTKARGRTEKVCVFKKDKHYISPIEDVGSQRYFNSPAPISGEKTLDQTITEYEGRFARKLRYLRELRSSDTCDAATAAEVVTHLTMRTKHTRQSISAVATKFAEEFSAILSDKNSAKRVLGFQDKLPNERIREIIQKEIKTNTVVKRARLPEVVLEKIGFILTKEKFDSIYQANFPILQQAFSHLLRQMEALTTDSHRKAMNNNLAPDERLRRLSALSWRIFEVSKKSILPDCVAVAIDGAGTAHPLFFVDNDQVQTVLMPISAEKILVGSVSVGANVDLTDANETFARCSNEFFLSSESSPECEALRALISVDAHKKILRTVEETLGELLPTQKNKEKITIGDGSAKAGPMSYQVSFLDCATQEKAEEIAAGVQAVTNAISEYIPLSRLDGITFANDYAAALNGLDRGFIASRPLTPRQNEIGLGMARSPVVVRDGLKKIRVVVRAEVGYGLMSQDAEHRKRAIHLLVYALSHAGCLELLEQALPEFVLGRIDDQENAYRYSCMEPAWEAYFCARSSAAFNREADKDYESMFIQSLDIAKNKILAERHEHYFHKDYGRLLSVSLGHISSILLFSAMLLGHSDGLSDEQFISTPELKKALAANGLEDWLVTYNRDLQQLWDNRGKWESNEEFMHLNYHVERLLWPYFLFPWLVPAGDLRLEVRRPDADIIPIGRLAISKLADKIKGALKRD